MALPIKTRLLRNERCPIRRQTDPDPNQAFSINELLSAINDTKNTTPGPDNICYEMFKAHLLSFCDHPALSLTEDCWQEHFPDLPGFCSFHMSTKTEVDHSVFATTPVRIPNIPPWLIRKPVIDHTLLQFVRQMASAFVAPVFSSHLRNIYDQFVEIYTDGSNTSTRAGCSIYIADRNLRYSITINKFSSSSISELFAILHALYLAYSLKIIKVVVITHSLISLQSITNWKRHSFANKIALLHSTLSASGYEVRFLWVPVHQNIPGNEIADQLVKLSTAKPSSNPPKCVRYKRVNTLLNFTDMLPYLYQHSFHAWEIQYQTDTRGHSYKIIFPALVRSSLLTHSLSTTVQSFVWAQVTVN